MDISLMLASYKMIDANPDDPIVTSESDKVFPKEDDRKTKRQALLKFELTGDVKNQLTAVQKNIYKIEIPPLTLAKPSKLSTKWRMTDELLYAEARSSYEKILKGFMRDPRVYKLESIKETVWKRSELEREGRDDEEGDDRSYISTARSSKSSHSVRSRRKSSAMELLESPRDRDVKTFIDPFIQGDMEEIWKEKLMMLEKLTPREDLNGFEYREDYDEQQYRISLMNDFQDRLKYEIYRRTFQPTLTEQVEDCLFDMVEEVCTEIDNRTYRSRLKRKAKLKQVRHPAVGAYRVKALEKKIGDEGQVVQALTDLDFLDVVITKGGLVLSRTIPLKVLLIHDHEREVLAEMKRREAEERENLRRLPLTKKLRIAVLSNADMQSLVRQITRDIVDSTIVLPSQPYREKLNKILKTSLRGMTELSKDPNKALDFIRDRMAQSYENLTNLVKSKRKKNNVLLNTSMEDILNDAMRIKAEQEQGRMKSLSEKFRDQEKDLNTKIPVSTPDSISVKLVLHYEPPSSYKIRARRTFNSEIEKLAERAKVAMDEHKVFMMENYDQIVKKGTDPVLKDVLKEAKDQIYEKKKEMYLAENIPVRKYVGSRFYNGFLRPENLILKPKEPNTFKKGNVEMVYDDSERKGFEEAFLNELSFAVCIPKENISIEQVRRLEVNSSKLKECIELKQKKIEENLLKHKEHQLNLALKRFIRKAESKGIILNEDIIYSLDAEPEKIETRFLLFPQINDLFHATQPDEVLPLLLNLSSQSKSNISDEDIGEFTASSMKEEPLESRSTDVEVVKEVLDWIISLVEQSEKDQFMVSNNLSQDLELTAAKNSSNIAQIPPEKDKISEGDGIVANLSQAQKEEGKINSLETLSTAETSHTFERIGVSKAESPKFFKLGLLNPSDMKYDSSYWFSKFLHEMDEKDKSNYRLQKLPALRNYYLNQQPGNYSTILKRKIDELKDFQNELQDDIAEYLEPFMEKLEPVLEKLKPYYLKYKEKTLQFLYYLFYQMKVIVRKQLEVLYQNQQFKDILQNVLKGHQESLKQQGDESKQTNNGSDEIQLLKDQASEEKDDSESSESVLIHSTEVIELMKDLIHQIIQRDIEAKRGLAQNPFAFDPNGQILPNPENEILFKNADNESIPKIEKPQNTFNKPPLLVQNSSVKNLQFETIFEEGSQSLLSGSQSYSVEKSNDEEANLSFQEGEDDLTADPEGYTAEPEEEENDEETFENEEDDDDDEEEKEEELPEEEDEEQQDEADVVEEVDEDENEGQSQNDEEIEDMLDEEQSNEEEKGLLNQEMITDGNLDSSKEKDFANAPEGTNLAPRFSFSSLKPPISATRRRPRSASGSFRSDVSEESAKNEKTKHLRRNRMDRYAYLMNPDSNPSTILMREVKQFSLQPLKPESSDPSTPVESNHSSRPHSRPSSALSRPVTSDLPSIISRTPKLNLDPETEIEKAEIKSPVTLSESQLNPRNFDDIFWQRVDSLDLYAQEIVSVMKNLCLQVEENVSYEESSDIRLYGCEITLNIMIRDEQRNIIPGLDELCAKDIAHFIQKQLYDASSTLNQGEITKHIVHIDAVPIYERYDYFEKWNSYWIHILHPIFFYYSVQSKDIDLEIIQQKNSQFQNINYSDKINFKREQEMMHQLQHQHQRQSRVLFASSSELALIPVSDSSSSSTSPLRKSASSSILPKGMKIVNPIHEFNPRTQEAFVALMNRPNLLPPGFKLKKAAEYLEGDFTEEEQLQQQLPPDMRQLNIDPQILDLHVDEFHKQMKTSGVLSLYRPNMENITEKDVSRCLRVYQAAKDLYEDAMKIGLEKNSLRPQQYSSLKFMQHSLRIYLTAKQKLEQMKRREVLRGLRAKDPFSLPLFEPTKIDDDIFGLWIQEVKEGDKERLKNRQIHAEKLKILLKQEALLRRNAQKLKYWIMESFIRFYLKHKPNLIPTSNQLQQASSMKSSAVVAPTIITGRAISQPLKTHSMSIDTADDESVKSALSNATEVTVSGLPPITLLPDDYLVTVGKIYQKYCDYYEYHHDQLELQTGLRLELEKKEEMIRLLQQGKSGITNPDIIRKFDEEQEKNVGMKKLMISEEKKTRRLFSLLVHWNKKEKFLIAKGEKQKDDTPNLSPGFLSPISSPSQLGRKALSPKNRASSASKSPTFLSPVTSPSQIGRKTLSPKNTITISRNASGSGSRHPSISTTVVSKQSLEFTSEKEEFTEADAWRLIDYIIEQFVSPSNAVANKHRASTGQVVNDVIPKDFLIEFLDLVFYFLDVEKSAMMASATFSKSHDRLSGSPRQLLLPPPPVPPLSPRTATAMVVKMKSEVDDDTEDYSKLIVLERKNFFNDDEWDFIKQVKWIQAVQNHPPFADCLYYLPTIEETNFQRDELIQFASILVDLSTLFNTVITTLNDKKYQAEVKLGINKIKLKQKSKKKDGKKRRKGQKDDINVPMTEEEKRRLHEEDRLKKLKEQEEYLQHLQNLKKQMEREKAWFMSHPHKYLLPRNHNDYLYFTYSFYFSLWKEKQDKNRQNNFTSKFDKKDTSQPFCIVCKQREYEYWLKVFTEKEEEYKQYHYQDKILNPQINKLENILLQQIEEEMKLTLQQQAKEIVEQQLIAEGLLPKSKPKKEKLPPLLENGEEVDDLRSSHKSRLEDNNSLVTSSSLEHKTTSTEEEARREKRKMEEYFHRLNVPIVNYDGQNIIVAYIKRRAKLKEEEKQRKLKRLQAKKKKEKSEKFSKNPNPDGKKEEEEVNVGDENPTLVITDQKMSFGMEVNSPVEYGIKVRVFHRNDQGEKAKFLGMIEITDKIMRKPPKGIRTYRLQPDPNVTDENEVDITGTLAVMINLISSTRIKKKRDDYKGDDNNNDIEAETEIGYDEEASIDLNKYEIITKYYWKLQIKRLTKVTAMDSSRLANPFCEVYYKGMVELPLNPNQLMLEEPETEDEKDIEEKHSNNNQRTLEGITNGEERFDELDNLEVNEDSPLALVPVKEKKKKKKKVKENKGPKVFKYLPDYIYIGSTKTNYRTIEFEYNEKENHDYSYYDLPPVYTPMIIPSSDQSNLQSSNATVAAASPVSTLRIGGYVSKHLLSEIRQFHKSYQRKQAEHQAKMKGNKNNSSVNLLGSDENEGGSLVSVIQQQREFQKFQELLFIELKFQLEIHKMIILNEEEERKKMASEEYELRSVLNQNLFSYYDYDIQVQDYYAHQFQKLLENIVSPSPMLQRLRFQMGEVEHPHHYYVSSHFKSPSYTPMTLVAAREAGYSNILQIGTDEYTNSLPPLPKKPEEEVPSNPIRSKLRTSQHVTKGSDSLEGSLMTSSIYDEENLSLDEGKPSNHMFSMSATLGLTSQESLMNAETNDLIRYINPPPTTVTPAVGGGMRDLQNISMREYMFHRFKQGKQYQTGNDEDNKGMKEKSITSHLTTTEASYDQIHNSIHQTEKKKKQQSLASNSSLIIRCEDPSTRSIVHVIIISIQSKSEERYLTEQLLKLVGKYAYYLMKIIDFAIHEVNIFNAQGFNTVKEKIGIIIKEYYHQTITLYDYLVQQWNTISNDEFREFLLQCVLAMKELHTEEIIHQNLSPNCFMIVFPNADPSTASNQGREGQAKNNKVQTKAQAKAVDKPMIKLDHYYILENPRNPKDSHKDLGRSDFGNYYTTPPEIYHALNQINEKLDVFSFGVCVYYFASKGQLLPFNPYTLIPLSTSSLSSSSSTNTSQYYYYQQEMEKCYANVSLKWGNWLINLLRMCLAFSPNHRASIQELQLYLSKRIGREKMKR